MNRTLFLTYLLAGHTSRLLRAPRARRRLNTVTGSIYLGLGAKVVLER